MIAVVIRCGKYGRNAVFTACTIDSTLCQE